jgi:hypothetical protein
MDDNSVTIQDLYARVQWFIDTARTKASDGLTWGEFGELLTALIRLAAETLDAVTGMTGAAKRAAVIEVVGMLFDAVADRCVPMLAYPLWLVVRPAARALVIAIAGGILEQVLPLTRAAK